MLPLTGRYTGLYMVKRYAGTKTVVHLHWLWTGGAAELRSIISAASLCGKFGLTREEVTSFIDDATCSRCKELAKKEEGVPGAPA